MYLIYHGCLGYFVPYHFRETETGSSQLLTECCHPTFHNQSRSRTHVSLETPPSNFFDSYFQAPNQLEFAKKEEKEQVPPFSFGAHIFTLGNENGNGIGAPMNQNEIGALRWKWRWKCNWIWTLGSLEPLPIPFSFLKRKWKWNWTSNELEAENTKEN